MEDGKRTKGLTRGGSRTGSVVYFCWSWVPLMKALHFHTLLSTLNNFGLFLKDSKRVIT